MKTDPRQQSQEDKREKEISKTQARLESRGRLGGASGDTEGRAREAEKNRTLNKAWEEGHVTWGGHNPNTTGKIQYSAMNQ